MIGDTRSVAALPRLELFGSPQLTAWLAEHQLSIAFSTYNTGKLFLIGIQPNGRLSVFERSFPRSMALYATADALLLSSLFQLWRFDNALEPGQLYQGYDRLYVPQFACITGDLDVHEVAVDANGRIIFVNTLFSCLATVSEQHSFVPMWQPPFINRLAAEDRCHLNGLAMRDGHPAFVTSLSRSNVADGWRDRRADGGVVVDIAANEIVLEGLSMPHSPRWYDERLWLLDSGTGYLGYVDLEHGRFERVAFCPGYARGLVFHNGFAVVGLSRPRGDRGFDGLALEAELSARDAAPRCGLLVIDLRNGDVVHWLRIDGMIDQLFDVALLLGVERPMALGVKTDEIRRVITIGDPEPL